MNITRRDMADMTPERAQRVLDGCVAAICAATSGARAARVATDIRYKSGAAQAADATNAGKMLAYAALLEAERAVGSAKARKILEDSK